MRKILVAGTVFLAASTGASALASQLQDPQHRPVRGNWYSANPYGYPHCSINGNDTVIVCDDGTVHLSPRAARRVRHGHNTIPGTW